MLVKKIADLELALQAKADVVEAPAKSVAKKYSHPAFNPATPEIYSGPGHARKGGVNRGGRPIKPDDEDAASKLEIHCTHCYGENHTSNWCWNDQLPQFSQCADPAQRKEQLAWSTNKWNYKAKAKANAAYALAAKAYPISPIAQAADAAATVFSAATPNTTPAPCITVDGGCNVSLSNIKAFHDVVVPGTIKEETTKFATAGNGIVSNKHGQLKINFKRNDGTSVLFTEPDLCASDVCPKGLILLSENSLIEDDYTIITAIQGLPKEDLSQSVKQANG